MSMPFSDSIDTNGEKIDEFETAEIERNNFLSLFPGRVKDNTSWVLVGSMVICLFCTRNHEL